MIANYINPEIIIPIDAVGIDKAIGSIQTKFGEKITWIEKVFGKCTIQREVFKQSTDKGFRKRERIYPQLYMKNGEPYDLMMNDNLNSYCFFIAHDPGEFQNYDFMSSQQFITRSVSIVFWFNCKKLVPNSTRPMNEELIISIVEALKYFPNFAFKQVFEEYKRVFEEFTIDENFRQYMRFPYSAFRIEGDITFPLFPENC